MNFRTAILRLGRAKDWTEAVTAIRQEHGSGTSRWISQNLGVSMRTAQRWQAGSQAPAASRRGSVQVAATPDFVAAGALRRASSVTVGHVKVDSKSTGRADGSRPVGTLLMDPQLRTELDQVAAHLEAGQLMDAEEKMSNALMGGYSAQRSRDARHIAPGVLAISDYPAGIDVT